MRVKKRITLVLALLVLLVLLVFPGWNPFLDEGSKLAVTAQIQRAFGGLFGGIGILTPARLISAAAVVVFMVIVSLLICWPLELLAKKGLYYEMYQDQYRDFESITARQRQQTAARPAAAAAAPQEVV